MEIKITRDALYKSKGNITTNVDINNKDINETQHEALLELLLNYVENTVE